MTGRRPVEVQGRGTLVRSASIDKEYEAGTFETRARIYEYFL